METDRTNAIEESAFKNEYQKTDDIDGDPRPLNEAAHDGTAITAGNAQLAELFVMLGGGGGRITGACTINRPCAQQYVGKSQSCVVISGRLIVHAPVTSQKTQQWTKPTRRQCGSCVAQLGSNQRLRI